MGYSSYDEYGITSINLEGQTYQADNVQFLSEPVDIDHTYLHMSQLLETEDTLSFIEVSTKVSSMNVCNSPMKEILSMIDTCTTPISILTLIPI
ncbi:hypothetical protein [Proteiniphilum acetatigenes]|uniref:hypothetical protein n=1 Tax=Proteiniphilum acetatigenes TaxID=294710 RepID=UPI0008E118F5|nr:hypothetical protein [Proteiniphilum acetatigenes]SFK85668.1 hypothetical protein SAMN05216357_10736 [Porphyromonadaceae bacterium KH3CP3RA]